MSLTASASERARINVTRAIKIALERIAEHNAALATLLTKSIRTGTLLQLYPGLSPPRYLAVLGPPFLISERLIVPRAVSNRSSPGNA